MIPAVDDTKTIDKNASQALQRFRDVMLVMVERPASKVLPSEVKLNTEEVTQFDQLVGKYAGLLPVLELPSNAAYGETAWLGARALRRGYFAVYVLNFASR